MENSNNNDSPQLPSGTDAPPKDAPKDTKRAQIAIVEDDDSIRELLMLNLQNEGFGAEAYFSVEQLDRKTETFAYDLLILDVMLPGDSGLTYAHRLREQGVNVPILFISALGKQDKIDSAYEAGAIDYIVKPFEMTHLLAKVKNLMFHFIKRHEAPLANKVGKAQIDWDLLQVESAGETHILTPKEAAVLVYFLKNPNKVVPRQELIEKVWGGDVYVTSRSIDNFLVKFRKWFEEDPSNPELFLTFPKKGYAYKP